MANEQAYPLSWPTGWPRQKSHKPSRFDTTLHKALGNVQDALRRFGTDTGKPVTDILISSNFTLGNTNPKDGGVAVYFKWDARDACIAVDRYAKLHDNLQAIYHVIEAERTKMRHGGLNIVRQSFHGYTALPPTEERKPWMDVLGFADGDTVTLEQVETMYKRLAKTSHPDATGGSPHRMAELNRAVSEARQALKM